MLDFILFCSFFLAFFWGFFLPFSGAAVRCELSVVPEDRWMRWGFGMRQRYRSVMLLGCGLLVRAALDLEEFLLEQIPFLAAHCGSSAGKKTCCCQKN